MIKETDTKEEIGEKLKMLVVFVLGAIALAHAGAGVWSPIGGIMTMVAFKYFQLTRAQKPLSSARK